MSWKSIFIVLFFEICFIVIGEARAISPEPLLADQGLSGYVSDSVTKETLIGATVSLKGTKKGAYTNKLGFFSISDIEPGKYTVTVSSLGYEKYQESITFSGKASIRKTFYIKPQKITTREISVEAEREIEQRQITISKVDIPVQQLKEIRVGGESDIFRSLQYLPGVLTSSQLSSGMFVRGGSPDQNLVLLDGSTVYNPSHLFGFISTFNTDAIKDVELIKGGFPAEFGGRLSAVLNLTQKDGNREKVEGIASLGAISSRATIEGPIGNGSWFIGGRRTYFEIIKKFLTNDPLDPLPDFNFYDLNAKITQNITDDDKVFLSGFMSADKLLYNGLGATMDLGISNKLIAGRWTHIFGDNIFSSLSFNYSNYINNFNGDQTGYKFLIENSISDYTVKGAVEWYNSEKLNHKFGFESTKYQFSYLENFTGDTQPTKKDSSQGPIDLHPTDWNHAVFAQVNYKPDDLLSLQAGLRANYWEMSKILSWDPRLAIRYQIQPTIALKAAFGVFHQYLRLASIPDFSFFDTWLPTDTTVPASKSEHYIFSIETQPLDEYDLNFDIYYKKMYNTNEINTNTFIGKTVRDIFYLGNTYSYGTEVFLQKKYGKLTGWLGYALGFITSQFDSINDGKEFRPKYDRRHDFKFVLQYQLDDDWSFGGTFTFQSGQSYTGGTSRFQMAPHFGDDMGNYGSGKMISSQRNGLRLPPSHQLNVNASYAFKMFGLQSKVIVDIYNVYNRRDIWFRQYDLSKLTSSVVDVKLIPILPSISLEVKF